MVKMQNFYIEIAGSFFVSRWLQYRISLDYAKVRHSRFINHLGEFNICRCFPKLDPVSPRVAPMRLLETGLSEESSWRRSSSPSPQSMRHNQETATGAVAQDRERQADLRLPGQLESRPRPLCRAARAGVWRSSRCHNADPAHAGSLPGGGSGV